MPGLPAPAQGRDCVKQDVVALLITQYLDPHFAKLYDLVQGDKHADMPIFLNSYDTPTAQDPTEDSGDWINEIHPNAAGWEKLPVLWHGAVKAMLK